MCRQTLHDIFHPREEGGLLRLQVDQWPAGRHTHTSTDLLKTGWTTHPERFIAKFIKSHIMSIVKADGLLSNGQVERVSYYQSWFQNNLIGTSTQVRPLKLLRRWQSMEVGLVIPCFVIFVKFQLRNLNRGISYLPFLPNSQDSFILFISIVNISILLMRNPS